jgi:hypothetical protein
MCKCCRSQWPRGLRRRFAAARLLRSWVRIPPGAWVFVVSVVCCQVEVSATSWLLVQRSPTRLWCVVVCDLETSWMGRPWPTLGCSATEKKSANVTITVTEDTAYRTMAMRWRYDWLTWYVRLTQKAIPSDDLHCFSMNMASDGEGMFIIWCISRRLKTKATRRKYLIHPWSKRSGGQFCCSQGIKWR